jgi:uncharacterized protein (TIGR01777 family)
MRVAVLGASGFVGRHLSDALRARGDTVSAASVRRMDEAVAACDGADAVVNLAGAALAPARWTPDYKEEIRRSRVEKTRDLIGRLRSLERKPRAYVTASAVGYYGASDDDTFVEHSPAGTDFLAGICAGWEREALRAGELGMRVAAVRCGLALGNDGGALEKMLPPFKLGLGGVVGNGKQWWSWVHIDDAVGIYLLAIDGADGALNATAPDPVRNREFTEALGRCLRRPTLFPVPGPMLALLLGEGADVLTSGQRVLPERTQALGYRFKHPSLDGALATLV